MRFPGVYQHISYQEKKGLEEDDDVDIYIRDDKDEESTLMEAMEAGKEGRYIFQFFYFLLGLYRILI